MKVEVVFPEETVLKINCEPRSKLKFVKGMLRDVKSGEVVGPKEFMILREMFKAWIETDMPHVVRGILSLNPHDEGVKPLQKSSTKSSTKPSKLYLVD